MNELPKTNQNLIDQLRGLFYAKDRPVILPKEGFVGFHSIDTPDSLPPYPYRFMYVKADGSLYLLDYEGNEYLIWSNIGTGYAPNDATYVTISTETALSNERVLTQGTGISIVDGGNLVTISSNDGQIDHTALNNLNSANYYHLTQTNHTDLTDTGDTALHYHSSDRARANHTGTQLASTISDFDEAAQDAVGNILSDTATIDFTYNDGAPSIVADVIPGGVDHDALLNFVANEHINHTAVTLTAGDGLSGGGDISANRTFGVNVDNATIEINTDTLRVKIDGINDTHIDWGTGVNQVSAIDMPIADSGGYFTTDNVEAALQQIGNAGGAGGFTQYYIPFGSATGEMTESINLQYDTVNLLIRGGLNIQNAAGSTDVISFFNTNNVAIGPDMQIAASGLIASEGSLLINIDSNNSGMGASFTVSKDSETSSATKLFQILESGFVGIGTFPPLYELDLLGDFYLSGNLLFGSDWILDHSGINLSLTSNISNGDFEINVNDGGIDKRVFLINASDNAKVFFGEDDLYRGFLTLYGDTTGVAFGGLIDFFTSADYGTNTEYYRLGTFQEKFTLRNDANDILTEVTHTGQLQIPTVGSSAGVLIGDELTWQPSTGLLRTNASVGINTDALYVLDVNGDSYFSDDMIITGNLAVGADASSPIRPLHVENTAPIIRISDSNAITDIDVIAYQEWYRGHNDNRIGFFGFSSASNENIVLTNSTTNGDIEFRTNSTESMRILDTGRVGIGVSLAKSILDVSDSTPILTLTDETVGDWDYGDSFVQISSYTNDTSGVWPGENAYIRSAHLRTGTGHANPDAGWVFGMSESTLLPEDSIFFSTLSDRVMVEIGYQDITKRGWLYLYGAATGNSIGAVIEMAPAADYDGTISSWRTEIYQDDYRIITSDSVTSLLYTYQGQLQLPSSGSGAGVLIGGDVQLYRSAANQLTVPDSVIANQFTSTIAVGTQPYACTSTTLNVNLNADLLDGQHGSYYLNRINQSGYTTGYVPYGHSSGYLNQSNLFTYDGTLHLYGGAIEVGSNDSIRGVIQLRGNSTDSGGQIVLYLGANQDGVIDYWRIEPDEDDLVFMAGNTTRATITQPGRFGINVDAASIDAMLHIDQSASGGNIPVLHLDQGDTSEEFVRFTGAAAAATLTNSIVDVGDVSTATVAGYIKIYVEDTGNQITDQAYYMPIYTLS